MPVADTDVSSTIGSTYASRLGYVEGITYKLQAGLSYVFASGGEIGSALNLSLYRFPADVVPYWAAPTLYVTPQASGDFTVFALNTSGKDGAYTLQASLAADDYSANAGTTGTIALGASRDGVLESLADRDWFASVLVAGQTYDFSLTRAGRALAVFDAAGNELVASTRAEMQPTLQFTPQVSGRYFIQVDNALTSSNNGSPVSYTLSEKQGIPDDVAQPQALALGTTVTGQIDSPNDTDSFVLNLAKNHFYQFVLEKQLAPGGLYERVVNSYQLEHLDGNAVLEIDSPIQDAHSDGYFVPTAGGTYRLAINHQNVPEIGAGYRLTVLDTGLDDEFPARPSGQPGITVGAVASGAIEVIGDTDTIGVALAAGQSVALGLYGAGSGMGSLPLSSDVSFYAELSDGIPTGSFWSPSGSVAHGDLTATLAGVYTVHLDSYHVTGSYLLRALDITGDRTAPLVSAAQPASFAFQAPLVLHFNELLLGAQDTDGTIVLGDAQGKAIASYRTGDAAHVVFAEDTLTLVPTAPLEAAKSYHLSFEGYAIADWAHNWLKGANDFSFSIAAPASVPAAGNDSYAGRNDGRHIDGGAGLDVVAYSGTAAAHTIASDGKGGFTVAAAGLQTDTLSGIERLYFSGEADALALDVAGNGGAAYRLYQAAFNRAPDKIGLGFWMAALDRGMSLHDVAQAFVGSAEFTARDKAAPDDASFVTQLYQNVLHRDGEAGGFNFWVGKLHDGLARADVLAAFSDSAENQAALATIIGNGFAYTPHL
ncbi:MAG: DUF4214 domain-containing protein [Pseudomonadota bacterium]